jgi:hypothetical protein
MGLRIRVVWIGPLASSGCGLVICRVRVCGLELPGWAAHAAAENLVDWCGDCTRGYREGQFHIVGAVGKK